MKTQAMLFAGAMLSLVAVGAQNDSFAERLYRAKYGRSTPAVEAREKALGGAEDKSTAKSERPKCCRNMNASLKNVPASQTSVEALFRSKYGRGTPAAETREKLAAQETAKHVLECVALGKCTSMRDEVRRGGTPPAAARDSWQESLFRAKYGRSFPGDSVLTAKADPVRCEHECCKGSE